MAEPQAGWYVIPSLSVSEEFDDNIYGQASERSYDLVTRFTPGFRAGYQSKPLALMATGGVDSEVFARHSDQTGVANRIRSGLEFRLLPDPATTLGLDAAFIVTQTPTELQPQLGVELGRRATTLWSAALSVTHRFDPATSGDASYSYSELRSNGLTSVPEQARLGLSSELSPVDTVGLHYALGRTRTGSADLPMSHTVTGGWTRRLAEATSVSIEGGPRLSGGVVAPDVSAALTHRLKIGALSLTYRRTESVIAGQRGRAETNSGAAGLTFAPVRSMSVALGAGVSNAAAKDMPTTAVYRANTSVSYRLTKWLSGSLSLNASVQDRAGVQIYHNTVTLGLDASYPIRAH